MTGAEALAELEAGERLGPYRLEERLGDGGMGIVFKAVRDPGEEVVALKVLRPELGGDETYRRRFAREGQVAATLSHPHLVPVLDAGEAEGHPYLAARYIAGRTLAQILESDGPLALSPLLRIAAEIATALDTLHREGLVHRDVKPSNILVDTSGAAFLTDFGLARGTAATVLTKPGHVVGTLDYLAPEVIRGSPAGPAADIYALGCVTYFCIAGRTPFADRPVAEAALAAMKETPADPCASRSDLPGALSFAVLQALAKPPADRPPTAAAYALMLRISARPVALDA
jgi:serine/threonine protein kinase